MKEFGDVFDSHWLPVPLETFSSWNQSALDDGVHVVSVPDVVGVLDEVIRQKYIVLQCRINEEYLLNVPELLGNTGNVWKN